MTDEQRTDPATHGWLEWFGAIVIATVLAALLSTGWVLLLWSLQGWLPSVDAGPDVGVDVDTVPIRSVFIGFVIAAVLMVQQLRRIATNDKGQWPVTAVITVFLTLATSAVSMLSEHLEVQAAMVTGLFIVFSVAHLFGAVLSRVPSWLVHLKLPGMAAALSLTALLPVCGGAAIGDSVARLSEPTTTIDGHDVVAGIERVVRDQCFQQVAGWRQEAVRSAQARHGLSTEDAEDVVGSVILSVCAREGMRTDLRSYFFKSVQLRGANPWRRASKDRVRGDGWERPLPVPSPETIVEEANGCLGRQMRALPEEQRRSLILLVLQGRSVDEAAALVGQSRSALDRTKQKALASLRAACP